MSSMIIGQQINGSVSLVSHGTALNAPQVFGTCLDIIAVKAMEEALSPNSRANEQSDLIDDDDPTLTMELQSFEMQTALMEITLDQDETEFENTSGLDPTKEIKASIFSKIFSTAFSSGDLQYS